MDKGSLGIQEIELVIKTTPCSGNSGGAGQKIVSDVLSAPRHDCLLGKGAQRACRLGKITSGDIRRRFIADAKLEAGWAPVNKLNCLFCFDICYSTLNILGDNIPTEKETASHCRVSGKIREMD